MQKPVLAAPIYNSWPPPAGTCSFVWRHMSFDLVFSLKSNCWGDVNMLKGDWHESMARIVFVLAAFLLQQPVPCGPSPAPSSTSWVSFQWLKNVAAPSWIGLWL